MKLLIVDDSDINLRLLRAQLEGEDVEVVEAEHGIAALRALDAGPVDGVISDILMPQMDGFRLCLEVRRDPRWQSLPFVLYTSTYNSPADRSLAESAGADAYIHKPAPVARLLAAIAAAGQRGRAVVGNLPPEVQAPVMQQYSETLIRKLEAKSQELEQAYAGMLHVEARLSGLVETAMDAIVALDESHRVVLFNAAAAEMFRCPPEQALGRPVTDFMPPRFRAAHPGHLDAFVRDPTPGRRMGGRWVWALRSDGSEFPVEASFSKLQTSQGRLFTAFLRDISERLKAEQALVSSEAGLRRAQGLAHLAHVISGSDGAFLSWSESMPTLLGVAPTDVPRDVRQWLALVHPDDREGYRRAIQGYANGNRNAEFEFRMRRGGDWADMRQVTEPLPIDGGDGPTRWFHTLQDVTDQKRAERRFRNLNRVHSVLSGINTLIVRMPPREDLFRESCRIAVEVGGFAKAWVCAVGEGPQPLEVCAARGEDGAYFPRLQLAINADFEEGQGLIAEALREGSPVVVDEARDDPRIGRRHRELITRSRSLAVLPLHSGGRVVALLVLSSDQPGYFDTQEMKLLLDLASDISLALEHLSKAEHIEFLANYDPLTGLANRSLFTERVGQRLENGLAEGETLAVVFFDLERFRRINDTVGRGAGDELLRQVAVRLRDTRASAARIGIDVFALLLAVEDSVEGVARWIEAVLGQCFKAPFLVAGEELRIGCRAGVAVHPGDGDDAEALLGNAEAALRGAKQAMVPSLFYSPALNARAAEALALESRLRRALEREEFVLHYQPKVRLDDGRVTGLEALIRWQDPELGLVPPGRFIPILEETGLIGAVGRWALQRALADQARWRQAGLAPPRVAVNVSALQFNDPGFAQLVIDLVAGAPAAELELELTESLIMADVGRSVQTLGRIREAGVHLSIDDFGTGYCSLSYIARLPVNALKIDRAFVNDMGAGPEGVAIVTTILALAQALRLQVIAEGVETLEQSRMLLRLGCEQAQGFLYLRPVPPDQIGPVLHAGRLLPREAGAG
ncbi:MAG: EAL domain-containing protein [Xanthomonadales bacterium]|nr:EAL domain-containing protein [Xanthomonadales bacterium]